MSLREQAAKNVSATWLGLLVHAVVGFFLSPFILHRLGDDAFSLWVLVFSLTGYYGLLDLGIRSSIVRYVAKFAATQNADKLSCFLSTSVAFYAIASLVVLLLTGMGFFHLQSLFKIPPSFLGSARVLFALAGAGVALSFPLSVFAAVLEGLQKFSWLHLSQVGVTLLRGLLIVIALSQGGGLVAIGAITVGMNLFGYLIFMGMAFRACPLRLSPRYVDCHSFWQMLSYSAFAFVILLAEKLRFQSDPILIGALLSSSAVTYFSIGSKLVEYSSSAVRSMAVIFTPMSSHLHATGDVVRLRRTLVAGNRACALIIFPLCAILVILGRSIIEVWVGTKYLSSYFVLVILAVPKTIYLAQSTSTRILLGIGRHRTLAAVLLLEGAINLILSIWLLSHFGIVGVALGTAIPLTFTCVFFLPRHVRRELDIPLSTFLSQAYMLPLSLCVPLAGVLLLMRQEFPAHHYGSLILQVACGGLLYSAGLGWALLAPNGPAGIKPWEALTRLDN
ncbi:MAG TPA: polysaccharide biosynthesis C-terminal domain-containing protein [Terriglobales bacterium]|nr:polysaccharide biosynthesis C-terminal domain-containing protein [Terriglobales bacterium]